MKTIKNFMLFVAIAATVLTSCTTDDEPTPEKNYSNVAYIVNYGTFGSGNGEISIYDTDSATITNSAYYNSNSVDFTSNIQSIAIHNNIAYFMSNGGDKIDIVDAKTLKTLGNPISNDIIVPRYFIAEGNTAYISCWGEDASIEWKTLPNSYIAKVDLTTKEVTRIALPGGPEDVTIIDNKLYAALTTTKKIAVIDLLTNDISYINTLAIPYHLIVDDAGYLWASMVSTWSVPVGTDSVGVTKIDPSTNTVVANVNYSGIGHNGYIEYSNDNLYIMGSEAWPKTGSNIAIVNTSTERLEDDSFISGEQFYGFGVNTTNNDIYVLIAPSAIDNGLLKVYDSAGALIDKKETGISPQHVIFYSIEEE